MNNDMMKQLHRIGLIPVIKIENAEDAVPLAKALIDGGLPAAEITFRTKCAAEAIKNITEAFPEMLVGAGTVLTTEQVDAAIEAGSKFLVSPGLNPKVTAYCLSKGVPMLPGCSNPSDVEAALELGLSTVKFFPAEAAGGLKMLKAMAAPYGQLTFMPTGGINENNLLDYLKFNKIVACGGSFMVFDGGDGRCIDLFMNAIESLADDKESITVAAWVITHIHNDHAYMLRELAKKPELVSRLKVERFIWNRPNEAHMTAIGDGLEESAELLEGMLGFEGAEVYTARAGQVYHIRNAVYTVYSTSEMLEPFEMASYNDACVVGLLEIDGCRIFFPGDSDRTQTKNLVKLYGEELRCDVLQVIHHGHNGGDTEAYMLFDPITVLWPVGSYRYSQEWEGNLPFSQWECNEWFFNEESSVENIYVAGKDVVTLVVKDLPRH